MVELNIIMLERIQFQRIIDNIEPNKVLILYGPRRVGKTVLLKQIINTLDKQGTKCKYANGESLIVQEQLSSQVPAQLEAYLEGAQLLVVDEAQQVPNIGLNLKLLVDSVPGVKIIASGSASFDLSQKVGEPLTGRKKTFHLYPISAQEIINNFSREELLSTYTHRTIFGGYPELFSIPANDDKQTYLEEIVDAYLLKDILEMEQVKGAKKLKDLLTLISFQIGKEVSLSELGNRLDLHKDTVARYLDLFEKAFILINIRGFSRNLRKEISKNSRYYFWDNGIRNALIRNFNPPNLRDDMGMLWENYLVVERIKKQSYQSKRANYYFWRTYDQKELDWIEERDGKLNGFEFKWSDKIPKVPSEWLDTYNNAEYQYINQTNFIEFVG